MIAARTSDLSASRLTTRTPSLRESWNIVDIFVWSLWGCWLRVGWLVGLLGGFVS
jgi:hypothetical protein